MTLQMNNHELFVHERRAFMHDFLNDRKNMVKLLSLRQWEETTILLKYFCLQKNNPFLSAGLFCSTIDK